MKRNIIFMLVLLITVCACISSYAHPGRTDSRGGHYDRSTGEYHYHHGYPAHQHENGVCPYDFDDKTSENSGSSSGFTSSSGITSFSGSSKSSSIGSAQTAAHTPQPQNTNDEKSDSILLHFGKFLFFAVIAVALFSVISLIFLLRKTSDLRNEKGMCEDRIKSLNDEIHSQQDTIKDLDIKIKTLMDVKSSMEHQIAEYKKPYNVLPILTYDEILKAAKVPDGVTFDEMHLPHYYKNPTVEEHFLVFVASSKVGGCYHRKHGCSGAVKPVHLFHVAGYMYPCEKCVPPSARLYRIPFWYYQYLQLILQSDVADASAKEAEQSK